MKLFFPVSALAIFFAIFAFSFPGNGGKEEGKRPRMDRPDKDLPIVINGPVSKGVLKTANGCGIGNFLIPLVGDSSQGLSPVVGSLSDTWMPNFNPQQTVPGNEIKGVAFKREVWPETSSLISTDPQFPYVIVSDTGMFSYSIPWSFDPWTGNLGLAGSLYIQGIRKMAGQITLDQNAPIVLYVNDSLNDFSLRFYDYPGLQEQFRRPFHFEPEVFEVTDEGLFITGLDTNGSYMLYHFGTTQDTLYAKYSLNDSCSNAQEFLNSGDSLFILSSPGDSITMLTTVLASDSSLSQAVAYSRSGARATYNEYKSDKYFTFQPIADFPDSILQKKILILNPLNIQVDTFDVGLELDVFKFPQEVGQSFGYFELGWVGAKWQGGTTDTAYIQQYGDVIKVNTTGFPNFINATYGCWVGIPQTNHERINFDFYPNPTSSAVTIHLTGLIKGEQYKMEIVDQVGKLHHTCMVEPYQKVGIPLERLAKGVYFLRLHAGSHLISKKMVIQ